MKHTKVIESQVSLLSKLNEQLATKATPEAAREIRENALAIVKLTEIQEGIKTQGILEDLEERLVALEEAIFGDEDVEKLDGSFGQVTFIHYIKNCREDLDNIYDVWGPALDRHLGADWSEEAGK